MKNNKNANKRLLNNSKNTLKSESQEPTGQYTDSTICGVNNNEKNEEINNKQLPKSKKK